MYFSNTLIVSGKEVHSFLEACKDGNRNVLHTDNLSNCCNFTFKGILPVPNENRLDNDIDAGEWQMKHWGTRSDAKFACVSNEDDEYIVLFETELSPPLNWLRKAIEFYPELDFELKYYEDMIGRAGEFCCKKGMLESITYDRCTNKFQYELFVSGL